MACAGARPPARRDIPRPTGHESTNRRHTRGDRAGDLASLRDEISTRAELGSGLQTGSHLQAAWWPQSEHVLQLAIFRR